MECGGLPLALVTVGRALRRENDMRHWENSLSQLKNPMGRIYGMESRVFTRLRFSIERRKDNVTRSCFLYCALYPEDHHIETEELIKYWEIGCQEGSWNEYVKMHVLIRDMAIAVTIVNPLFMIRAGRGIRVPPVENEWLYNSLSKGILPSFFNHLGSLKVLDLSYTGIASLDFVNVVASCTNLANLEANFSTLHDFNRYVLSDIPTLRSICRGPMICDSLTSIEVIDCPELEIIPFFLEIRQQLVDSLKQIIKGSRRWWWTLGRNHPIPTSLLAPLFKPESAPNEDIRVDSKTVNSYDGSSGSSFGQRLHSYCK
ncbi:disease resistance protein [Nicotiana attenuata]|uniref:Disease resistance protein n=1 Tax=Nicotiana attenuata TaxID=49451 RepID=A0A1J6KBG3_NICAT|nr:disease resistance protein [Nicotiana attenuata]OIT21530.1 disease resistance protein [Nicotiana attenuata]OIT22296.1 disease resistance protein [Nicotiana attenuata]